MSVMGRRAQHASSGKCVRRALRFVFGVAIANTVGYTSTVLAAGEVDIRTEHARKVKASQDVGVLGPNLAGDFTSLQTGTTTFAHTDISIPGPGPAVALGRRYELDPDRNESWAGTQQIVRKRLFGDWDLDIPYLSGVYTNQYGWEIDSNTPSKRCSVLSQQRVDFNGNTVPATGSPRGYPQPYQAWWPTSFWHGVDLNVPGAGKQTMLVATVASSRKPTSGGPHHWTTTGDWWFSCLDATANGGPGEAFVGHAPNGDKYTFNHYTWRWVTKLRETICNTDGMEWWNPSVDPTCNTRRLTRKEYFLLPTRVEDRFGNYVDYVWSNDEFAQLQSITASDGRQITLSYNAAGYVASASDGTRNWTYDYNSFNLTMVTLPDQSKWILDMVAASPVTYPVSCQEINEPIFCYAPPVPSSGANATITHPSGASVDFLFDTNFRPGEPMFGGLGGSYPVGLISKAISGPGLQLQTWTFRYWPTREEFRAACTPGPCPMSMYTDAIGPDGSITRSTFGIAPGVNKDLLLSEQRGYVVNGTPTFLSTTTMTHTGDAGLGFTAQQGTNPMLLDPSLAFPAGLHGTERKRPVKSRDISVQGVTFKWNATTFDAFGRAATVMRSNVGNAGGDFSRTEVTTYHDNKDEWVIGQVAQVTDSPSGKILSKTDYHATSDLPWKSYGSGGLLKQTMTYDAKGLLASVADGKGNAIDISDWYRGVPRRVDLPTGPEYIAATVNPDGTLETTRDEFGNTTSYDYDDMGRMKLLTYPTGDTVAWNAMTRGFVQVQSIEYGLPAGHWRQTLQTGNGKTTTYYDARFNPVLSSTEDTAPGGSRSVVLRKFDAEGRETFSSYPVASANFGDTLTGITTVYDSLGRVVEKKQDSELGVLTTTMEYLTGFKTKVSNPRGYSTTTSYQVFDSPSTDVPVRIEAPQGVLTIINRDAFGKPLSITRSGPGN